MTSDEGFVSAFESQQWPQFRWHHRDHIRLAYLYLLEYPFDEALHRIREGIKAHNAAHSVEDTPTTGYHETMTVAWMRLVEMVLLEAGQAESGDEFCDTHPELMQTKILRLFYSKDRFLLPRAKTEFVEPDLTPLPVARCQQTNG